MGSLASLELDGYTLWSTRSYADPLALSLFREADRRVRLRVWTDPGPASRNWVSSWLPIDAANAALAVGEDGTVVVSPPADVTWNAEVPHHGADAEETAGGQAPPLSSALSFISDVYAANAYVSSVSAVRDRLEAMGFTLGAARRALEQAVADARSELDDDFLTDDQEEFVAERRAVLNGLTFDAWRDAFAWIKARGAHEVSHLAVGEDDFGGYLIRPEDTTPLVRYLLDQDFEHRFGFPWTGDHRHLVRAALEACPDAGEVVLDLTAVIHGGYYSEDAPVVEEMRQARRALYPADAPTLVLTEGSSDAAALAGALRVLYPHLVDVYSFMDFRAVRARGGADALVGTVKAFAAAGVANRVVALFDNDAAAREAMRELRGVRLPDSVRVLTYPTLPLAAAYPTLRDGHLQQTEDVNGRAASLELYLGEDVLRDASGDLTPVVWGARKPGVGESHGEVREKSRLRQRFIAKLRAAERDPSLVSTQDWRGMRAILDALRRVFI